MTQAITGLRARLGACRGVLVDSYVLLDVATNDPRIGTKRFLPYRRRGGSRTSPLPDFYIGAHAASGRLALLTRDAARYRSYFPRSPDCIHRGGRSDRRSTCVSLQEVIDKQAFQR